MLRETKIEAAVTNNESAVLKFSHYRPTCCQFLHRIINLKKFFFFSGVVPYFFVSGSREVKSDGSILLHYPHLQNDASRIQFACSANSEDELKRALNG